MTRQISARFSFLLFFLSSIAVSGIPLTNAAIDEHANLQNAVTARELAFSQSLTDLDIDAFADFVSEEAIFFNGNEPIRGRDAVLEAWSVFFTGDAAPFSWQPDVVQVLDSGELALSSGPVLNPAGEKIGRFNSIWRLEDDGQWRVIFDKGS